MTPEKRIRREAFMLVVGEVEPDIDDVRRVWPEGADRLVAALRGLSPPLVPDELAYLRANTNHLPQPVLARVLCALDAGG